MNPKIRMLGSYGDYRVGSILSPPGSLRKILLDRGLAVLVDEPAPAPKTTLGEIAKEKAKKSK